MLKVHVGDVLIKGIPTEGSDRTALRRKGYAEALATFNKGDILVIPQTCNDIMRVLKSASGITEQGDASSHAAVVGATLEIPVIVGAQGATSLLKRGTTVTLDAKKGIVIAQTK